MIDFSKPVLDLTNKPVSEEMTIGTCCIAALTQIFQGEEADATVKVKRFKIAVKISGDTAVSLTADEIAAVKLVVGKYWNPLVVGRVFEAIDPASMKADA